MQPNTLSCRQLLTNLQPGEHVVMRSVRQPDIVITQASRVGDIFYLTGPLFSDLLPELVLAEYLQAAKDEKDEASEAVARLNRMMRDCEVPSEAHVFVCSDLGDALQTLAGLFAAYC